MNIPKIAIIGGGAVGTGFLKSFVDHISIGQRTVSGQIIIFDEHTRIGPGLAYGEDMATNLLNRPASGMSLNEGNQAEFYQWIRNNWTLFHRFGRDLPSSETFLPRSFFGRYLEDQWDNARQKGKALGLDVGCVHSKVTDIILGNNETNYRLQCVNGTGHAQPSMWLFSRPEIDKVESLPTYVGEMLDSLKALIRQQHLSIAFPAMPALASSGRD